MEKRREETDSGKITNEEQKQIASDKEATTSTATACREISRPRPFAVAGGGHAGDGGISGNNTPPRQRLQLEQQFAFTQ